MSHPSLSKIFNANEQRVNWHDETLWTIRKKRDRAAQSVEGWEALRDAASSIKNKVLANLHDYLVLFENNAKKNGAVVHWAVNADEHNAIVHSILVANRAASVMKSKSMLTEECHLNTYLEKKGISVTDTDLGERIVQLAEQAPSHIVLPAIHMKKKEIGELFHHHLGTPAGCTDPQLLATAAREIMREKFLRRDVAITGVNFAVASTGELVVCTNEGNADVAAHLSPVHIASMGIEKIIPERKHLGIFLRLLARSATGQPITTYSSHFHKPRAGQQLHIIIVDNGRTRQLAREDFRNSLKCIRCGACFNTCPVYRRSGGHSYHNAIAGPIGSILAPNLDLEKYKDLPFASTLCGSCSNVCPVKIDIDQQLYKWRQEITKAGHVPAMKTVAMRIMSVILSRPRTFAYAGNLGRWVMRHLAFLLQHRANPWYRQRDLPAAPEHSFRHWYKKNRR